MKNFHRSDLMFSLCGLNCALCTMKLGGYCPGCGGGAGNQSCAIAKCSLEHGGYQYCFECGEYPCDKYDGIDAFDSFITHRRQLNDTEKAKRMGLTAYHAELEEKSAILRHLLQAYNDGRRKTVFSLGVNLLELSEMKAVMQKIESEASPEMTVKEKAAIAAKHLEAAAKQNGITLKLNQKPTNAK